MDEPAGVITSEDLHATYLDRSRKELQKKIEQLQRSLAEVCQFADKSHITVLYAYNLPRKTKNLILFPGSNMGRLAPTI